MTRCMCIGCVISDLLMKRQTSVVSRKGYSVMSSQRRPLIVQTVPVQGSELRYNSKSRLATESASCSVSIGRSAPGKGVVSPV